MYSTELEKTYGTESERARATIDRLNRENIKLKKENEAFITCMFDLQGRLLDAEKKLNGL
tara:strand:- start:1526 stop:1705 length:180 start_codon:yes stop_codon:yes gene_type:complete